DVNRPCACEMRFSCPDRNQRLSAGCGNMVESGIGASEGVCAGALIAPPRSKTTANELAVAHLRTQRKWKPVSFITALTTSPCTPTTSWQKASEQGSERAAVRCQRLVRDAWTNAQGGGNYASSNRRVLLGG